jgi:hypothetical protein
MGLAGEMVWRTSKPAFACFAAANLLNFLMPAPALGLLFPLVRGSEAELHVMAPAEVRLKKVTEDAPEPCIECLHHLEGEVNTMLHDGRVCSREARSSMTSTRGDDGPLAAAPERFLFASTVAPLTAHASTTRDRPKYPLAGASSSFQPQSRPKPDIPCEPKSAFR